LRDQRKYLHSTDIFEQIINLKKNSNLFDLNINFKKQINNLPFLTVNNKPSQTKQAESNVYFRFKIAKKILFGYIFQSKKKFINRRGYNEKNFQRKVRMDRKCVYIPNFDEFNFIEKVTSGAMKFLKRNSPEKRYKWYLANLNMNKFLKKKKLKNLKLISIKKTKKIFLFEIISYQNKIGNMLFIKK